MRPQDFLEIKERQEGFKELMDTERSLGIQRKSDILPIDSTESEYEIKHFPFTKNASSAILKAYNRKNPLKGIRIKDSKKITKMQDFNLKLNKFEKDLVHE